MSKPPNVHTIFDHTFKHAKRLAKNFYFKKWVKHPSKCPAFQGNVISVGREGWEHIVDDPRKTKMDILGRFFCLEGAKYLLETASTYQDYKRHNTIEYWIFEGVVRYTKITVVVRSIKKGNKHFYSVIRKGSVEKEIKPTEAKKKEMSPA